MNANAEGHDGTARAPQSAPPILPEHRGLLPLFVGLGAALLVIGLLVAMQLFGAKPGPGEPSSTPSRTPSPSPTSPIASPPAATPTLPLTVGSYSAVGSPGAHTASYRSSKTYVIVMHRPGATVADAGLTDAQNVGSWSCGSRPELRVPQCVRAAHEGLVVLRGTTDAATLAAFGEQLLAAWK